MTQRIKVLHLCASLSVGGAERFLLDLAQRFDRERFEIHICCLNVLRNNALQDDFERLGLPLYIIGTKRLYDLRSILAVARYVHRHQIDIIHTQLTNADIVGRIVGRALGRPIISTLQNEPHDYHRFRWIHRWLNRVTARYFATRLIAVSNRLREQFIRAWHIPEDRIHTIYNAVPMEAYLAIPEGRPDRADHDGPIITNIGRLSTQKAQHHLLDAARLVLDRRPDVRFMIVGQGRLDQPLKEQAQRLGIAERVTFTGLRHDIPAILAQTDIFTLPSLWEGLPLTGIEAMASARPVVLTDVGGNRELVESGVHGMIVPPGDVHALADALLELLNDEPRRLAMGRAARQRVRHEFDITTIAAQYEALYQAMWSKRNKAVGSAQVSVKS
ncbi:MAG TPA: glycosyltransferase family 4 protein [Herpetosiphonaceae bacterium]